MKDYDYIIADMCSTLIAMILSFMASFIIYDGLVKPILFTDKCNHVGEPQDLTDYLEQQR